jgi:hypothetical protein
VAEKKVEVKKYEVSIKVDGSVGTIYRPGMPFIVDKIDSAVEWLSENFKEVDVEIIGFKPSCWEKYFPVPAPIPEPIQNSEPAAIAA